MKMSKRKVTAKDVAACAGVSETTVSMILNGKCCNLCGIEMPEFLKQGKELLAALMVSLILVTFISGISTLLPIVFC